VPEQTPLYRLASTGRDELIRSWDDLFRPRFGALRTSVTESLDAFLDCGILAHGCARAACPECRHSELIPFSCKQRALCPSCDAKRAVIFAENVVERVLKPLPHVHCVFTVPKRIRAFFRFDRKLLKHIYAAAWNAWSELSFEQCPDGAPAAILALHTAGDLLAFHPHVHGIFLAGALRPDGSFAPLAIDQARLQHLFALNVLRSLHTEGLLSPEQIDNILSWPHSGFSAFIGDTIDPDDRPRLFFLARYLRKCPLSNERIQICEEGSEAIIRYRSSKGDTCREFTPLEFLAELSQHIPDRWEQTSRFLGAYSSRYRGARRLRQPAIVDPGLPEFSPRPSRSWARLIKKIFEVDPLLCPRCGGTMKIKAFMTDPAEIDRISRNLGLPDQRAPPKLRYRIPAAA